MNFSYVTIACAFHSAGFALVPAPCLLFYHVEEHTGEHHAEEHQHRDDDAGCANDGGALANELRADLVAAFCIHVRQRRIVLARLALNAVDLLAASNRQLSVPVTEGLNAATPQARLRGVPGLRHLTARSIQFNRRVHLLLHRQLDLLSEHIAENSADQHRHEDQKQQDEVLQARN